MGGSYGQREKIGREEGRSLTAVGQRESSNCCLQSTGGLNRSLLNCNFYYPVTSWILIPRLLLSGAFLKGWGLTGQRWGRCFHVAAFLQASCSWFTQERRGCWINRAKLCEEESGIWGFDDFCCRHFLLGLRKYILCLLLLASNNLVLMRWRCFREREFWEDFFLTLDLNLFLFFPSVQPRFVVVFPSNFFQYFLCHVLVLIHQATFWTSGSCLPNVTALEVICCTTLCLQWMLCKEILQIFILTALSLSVGFLKCLSLVYFTFLSYLPVCIVRTVKPCSDLSYVTAS